MNKINALFVETNGPYFNLEDVEAWDREKDARNYFGPEPVVAHPPCNLWCKMTKINYIRWGGIHNLAGNDGGCFFHALWAVRTFGGVLEHPAQSYAWKFFGLEKPEKTGWKKTLCGGYVCEVWQSAYGHKANKATWLYYSGELKPFDLDWRKPKGEYQIGFHDQRGKGRNKKTLSGKKASETPARFRDILIKLARASKV
jgi:hypothetical protein